MRERDGGVACEQEHGKGAAHHEAAPDDAHALSRQLDAVVVGDLDAGGGRGRSKADARAGKDARKGCRRAAVHVLVRCDGLAGGLLVEGRRQRAEEHNAVHGSIGVQLVDACKQFGCVRIKGKHSASHVDAAGISPLHDGTLVGDGGAIVAHAHDSKGRADSAGKKRVAGLLRGGVELFGDRLSQEQLRVHGKSILSVSR